MWPQLEKLLDLSGGSENSLTNANSRRFHPWFHAFISLVPTSFELVPERSHT